MKLIFDAKISDNYKSQSQRARVLTVHWVDKSAFCSNCGHLEIDKYPNNQPVADFFCSNCREDYELKSKHNSIGIKILDGAYRTKMERLQSSSNPNLFVLDYNLSNLCVFVFSLCQNISLCRRLSRNGNPSRRAQDALAGLAQIFFCKKFRKSGKYF